MITKTREHTPLGTAIAAGTIALLLCGTAQAGPNCDKNPSHPSCGDGGGGGPDSTPPADVGTIETDATTNTITLSFVAPGDDGTSGDAAQYDIRISATGPIDDSNFASAARDPWSEVYTPKAAGETEYWTIRGRESGTTYYVAVKALDDADNVSAIQTATVATPPESPPVDVSWSVSTIATEPDGVDGQSCCTSTSVVIDDGQPAVTYRLGRNGARYAARAGDGTWTVEDIGGPAFINGTLAAEFDRDWLLGLTLGSNPVGGPEVIAWGSNQAVVTDPKGRDTSREAIIFAARQGPGDWTREVINDGGFEPGGSGDHDAASLVYVPDQSGTPTPTTAFVTWPVYGKKTRTNALTIAGRTAPGVWNQEHLFECPHNLVNPYIPVIGTEIRLHVDAAGQLHFVTTIAGGIIGGYKDAANGWQYYWTGVLPGQIRDTELITDADNNPLVVFVMDSGGGDQGPYLQDLYLLDVGVQPQTSITAAEACSPPQHEAAGYELIDSHRPDTHDGGIPDTQDLGNMVDGSPYVRVDGLLQDANGLYVGTLRFEGLEGRQEHRILARCGDSSWVRDATDRTRATGRVVITSDGMARVYYRGKGYGDDWGFAVYDDEVLFAERAGTPCTTP